MIPKDLYALDLGTTKFCLARIQPVQDGALPRIETVSIEAQGMHRGMLADINKASGALNRLLEIAEKEFNDDVTKVVVGVAGSHLKSETYYSQIKIPTPSVKPELVTKIKEQVQDENHDPDREVLHTIPVGYKLDDREWIDSPTGFSGQILNGRFFTITADKHYLLDIIKLCNTSGLEVKRLIAEPYASAMVTTTEEARKIGVAVADIGGGTTDGIIFQDGIPVDCFSINIGGNLMTKDIAVGLGLPYLEAEKAKLKFGLKKFEDNDFIEVANIQGQVKKVSWRHTYPILSPRVLELSRLLNDHLKPYKPSLKGALLLTGGGSDVKNISGHFNHVLQMSCGTIKPQLPKDMTADLHMKNITDEEAKSLSSKYATVSGLLYIEIQNYNEEAKYLKSGFAGRYFSQFVSWLKELS